MIICVPTPLNKNREPDISSSSRPGKAIAPHLPKGMLVVLESTTYPGTTDEDLRACSREDSGLKAGKRLPPGLLARTRGPGQPDSIVATSPRSSAGYTPPALRRPSELY